MKADSLRSKMAEEFGINKWPETYSVDAETYGNVCQAIFDWHKENNLGMEWTDGSKKMNLRDVAVGPNNGIMFKNVELILEPNFPPKMFEEKK